MHMSLILAIEPDRRQASHLDELARNHLHTELLIVDSATRALDTLAERVPDVILTSALLSPREDAALSDRLRDLGAAAAHIQTLTIPIFSVEQPASQKTGVFAGLLKRRQAKARDHGGCEPSAFAEQIAAYLERAALERGLATPPSSMVVRSGTDAEAPAAVPAAAIADDEVAAIAESVIDERLVDEQVLDGTGVGDRAADDDWGETPSSDELLPLAAEDTELYDAARVPDASEADVPFFNLELEWLDAAPSERPTVGEDLAAVIQPSEAVSEAAVDAAVAAEPALDPGIEDHTAPAVQAQMENAYLAARIDPDQAADDPIAQQALDGDQLPTIDLEWLAEEPAAGARLDAQDNEADAIRVAGCKAEDLEVDLTMLSRFIDESRLGQDPAYEMEVGSNASNRADGKDEGRSANVVLEAARMAGRQATEPPQPGPQVAEVPAASKLRSLLDFEKHVAERISRTRAEKAAAQAKAPANGKKPVQDEWGLFDPEQCGFSALIEKLEEISTEDPPQPERARERFRIIS
jgi:hypothetical protein